MSSTAGIALREIFPGEKRADARRYGRVGPAVLRPIYERKSVHNTATPPILYPPTTRRRYPFPGFRIETGRKRSAAARAKSICGLSAATTLMTHLVPQLFVFMLSHFLSSFLDYASQGITSLPIDLSILLLYQKVNFFSIIFRDLFSCSRDADFSLKAHKNSVTQPE
jgi:hypothetical protein